MVTDSEPAQAGNGLTWSKDLNWSYTENGPANPVANAGIRTLFSRCQRGIPRMSEEALLVTAAALVERAGLRPDRGGNSVTVGDVRAQEWYEPVSFFDPATGNKATVVTLKVCSNDGSGYGPVAEVTLSEGVSQAMETAISQAFAQRGSGMSPTCRLSHSSVPPRPFMRLGVPDEAMPGYTLEYVTGTATGSFESASNVSTLFSLKRNGVEVGKGLWAYRNDEMGLHGPTLELIEIAKEYQRQGLGRALYVAMEAVVLEPFKPMQELHVHVSYVTNEGAARFFCGSAGFRDNDGMLEELTKKVFWVPGNSHVWEWDEGDEAEGLESISQLDRGLIEQLLPAYNAAMGKTFVGREVRGHHTKPCTRCGVNNFWEFCSMYYTSDSGCPWDAEKFCEDCMREEIAEFQAEHPTWEAPQGILQGFGPSAPWVLTSATAYLRP